MNKIVKDQLNKCIVKLPTWDDNTEEIIIKYNSNNEDEKEKNVLIKIEDYIINEPPNFTLAKNWNKNTTPPESEMYVKILKKQGRMYRVSGQGVVTKEHWEGWLPEKGFDIL